MMFFRTYEPVSELTESRCVIFPVPWLTCDETACCAFRKCKSRLVGCGDFETAEGLRADSPTADADPTQHRVQPVRIHPFL